MWILHTWWCTLREGATNKSDSFFARSLKWIWIQQGITLRGSYATHRMYTLEQFVPFIVLRTGTHRVSRLFFKEIREPSTMSLMMICKMRACAASQAETNGIGTSRARFSMVRLFFKMMQSSHWAKSPRLERTSQWKMITMSWKRIVKGVSTLKRPPVDEVF